MQVRSGTCFVNETLIYMNMPCPIGLIKDIVRGIVSFLVGSLPALFHLFGQHSGGNEHE